MGSGGGAGDNGSIVENVVSVSVGFGLVLGEAVATSGNHLFGNNGGWPNSQASHRYQPRGDHAQRL